MPSGTPTPSAMDTAITPADNDARVPQITRDSRSRPTSSVPNQCSAEGGLRTSEKLVCSGSKGAIHAAPSASTITPATTASPNTAVFRRNRRRSARLAGLSASAFIPSTAG